MHFSTSKPVAANASASARSSTGVMWSKNCQ